MMIKSGRILTFLTSLSLHHGDDNDENVTRNNKKCVIKLIFMSTIFNLFFVLPESSLG